MVLRTDTAQERPRDEGRGRFLSLPPDLTTGYLQGHYPHRDPQHPNARYRHRPLKTVNDHGVDRFNGEPETIPAGALCDFEVTVRTRFSANGRSFWTIDEGWDYFWDNPDGTVFIEGTGTHFWVHDKHRKFRMYGTWHLLEDLESGVLLYERYIRDKTSVWDGDIAAIDGKICQFLAPAGS